MRRRIRFAHKRNRNVYGLAYPHERRIEIDPRLAGQSHLDIALHEGLHVLFPHLDEATVDAAGTILADLIWRLGYRRPDDEDE